MAVINVTQWTDTDWDQWRGTESYGRFPEWLGIEIRDELNLGTAFRKENEEESGYSTSTSPKSEFRSSNEEETKINTSTTQKSKFSKSLTLSSPIF